MTEQPPIAPKTNEPEPLTLRDGEITTATSRLQIVDYVANRHSALYVDQAHPLNVCGMSEEDERARRKMEAPLMLDAQTANLLFQVRQRLDSPKAIANFEKLSWKRLVDVCWSMTVPKTPGKK
jgi:hypothetical protein